MGWKGHGKKGQEERVETWWKKRREERETMSGRRGRRGREVRTREDKGQENLKQSRLNLFVLMGRRKVRSSPD